LAEFKRQSTDRNRTSPIAFTGNKFEFRAVGSSHNPSWSTTILNTITADSLSFLDKAIQQQISNGKSVDEATRFVVAETLTRHERVLFDGDGYSQQWQQDAAARGLLNLKSTPEAYKHLLNEKNFALFEHNQVLSRDELRLREYV
jgi:glutamine synthetase